MGREVPGRRGRGQGQGRAGAVGGGRAEGRAGAVGGGRAEGRAGAVGGGAQPLVSGRNVHGPEQRELLRAASVGRGRRGAVTAWWSGRGAWGQATVQVAPLSRKPLGAAVFPVWVAWKPMLTEAFAAMAAL
jgi:hypothetical protein